MSLYNFKVQRVFIKGNMLKNNIKYILKSHLSFLIKLIFLQYFYTNQNVILLWYISLSSLSTFTFFLYSWPKCQE